MKVTPEVLNNPQAFQNFQKAQDGLSSALSRLMVVVEKYPELKSNENFLQLQSQLEGTENRIAVERRNFSETVKDFNSMVKSFPTQIIASFGGFHEAQYFQSIEGSDKAPQVKF
jgi:LemA protein